MNPGDPLIPHLVDILQNISGDEVILAGGLGMRVKQDYLVQSGIETLMVPFPLARATTDIDLFLSMEVFMSPELAGKIRKVIDQLGYKPTQRNWQFTKPLGEAYPGQEVTIDFLSRHPAPGEKVQMNRPRVGQGELHGRDTQEAFAIAFDPLIISLHSLNTSGAEIEARAQLPHPYSWINMKVRAAHDWLRRTRGELDARPFSEKHAFDVYALIAMLTEAEIEQCKAFALLHVDNPIARSIQVQAHELFDGPDSPGIAEIKRQLEREIEFDKFREGLYLALGIPLHH